MKTINLPGAVLTAHDSPHSLPEYRRVEHDYYAMIEANVGSSIEDVDRHFEQMLLLVGSNDVDAQVTAVNNTRFLFFNILNRQPSARALALACLVETVDGVAWTDYSEAGVEKLVRLLSDKGLSDALVVEHWPELKKKLETS
jgi:hypothetical protein